MHLRHLLLSISLRNYGKEQLREILVKAPVCFYNCHRLLMVFCSFCFPFYPSLVNAHCHSLSLPDTSVDAEYVTVAAVSSVIVKYFNLLPPFLVLFSAKNWLDFKMCIINFWKPPVANEKKKSNIWKMETLTIFFSCRTFPSFLFWYVTSAHFVLLHTNWFQSF